MKYRTLYSWSELIFRIVDWEHVGLIPLRLSALMFQERLYQPFYLWYNISISDFHVSNAEKFEDEIRRLAVWNNNTQPLTELQYPDYENLFLSFLYQGLSLSDLNLSFPRLVEEVLLPSAEQRADFVLEWNNFASEFYINLGRPVPERPAYIYIQESLGIVGRGKYYELYRKFRRAAQEKLKVLFDRLCIAFPTWKWAARKRCYLSGALSERYELPSGGTFCRRI